MSTHHLHLSQLYKATSVPEISNSCKWTEPLGLSLISFIG